METPRRIFVRVEGEVETVFELPMDCGPSIHHAYALCILRMTKLPDDFLLITRLPDGRVTYVLESPDSEALIEEFWGVKRRIN